MTFESFQKIVKERRPGVTVFQHGDFATKCKNISVAVIYGPVETSKVYTYYGTYCEVLNRLGIKAIYAHDLKAIKSALAQYIERDGSVDFFSGEPVDYSAKIAEYAKLVEDYEKNYIIV